MAKYTQLFSEYLAQEGRDLPPLFNEIEGFKDLFIGEYCDSEIGFETPTLFEIKLNARAELVIPQYIQRIAALKEAKENLLKPTKTRIKTGQLSRIYGPRTNGNADQPMNIDANNPSAFQNPTNVFTELAHTDNEKYDNITDTESGYTPTEADTLYKGLETSVFLLMRNLLNEFKDLFMGVY